MYSVLLGILNKTKFFFNIFFKNCKVSFKILFIYLLHTQARVKSEDSLQSWLSTWSHESQRLHSSP